MKHAPHHSAFVFLLVALFAGGCSATTPSETQAPANTSMVGTISPGDDGTILVRLPSGETRQEFVEHFTLYEELAKHQGRMMRVFLEHKMTPMPPDDRLEKIWVVTGYQLL